MEMFFFISFQFVHRASNRRLSGGIPGMMVKRRPRVTACSRREQSVQMQAEQSTGEQRTPGVMTPKKQNQYIRQYVLQPAQGGTDF